MVAGLQEFGPLPQGHVLSERSEDLRNFHRLYRQFWEDEVDVLHQDEEADLWGTKVKFGVGPAGGDLILTGEDVLTIVRGKIKALYAFIDAN